MNNKKGFTLIELIVVLGLTTIVIGVVMSFFIANYKSYETINTESEVQYQSQYIINYMTNIILEAEKYEGGKFKFINGEKAEFKKDGNKIKHTTYKPDGAEVSVSIGNFVKEEIDINNIGSGEVEIELILDNKNKDYIVKQTIFMRNYSE